MLIPIHSLLSYLRVGIWEGMLLLAIESMPVVQLEKKWECEEIVSQIPLIALTVKLALPSCESVNKRVNGNSLAVEGIFEAQHMFSDTLVKAKF